MDLLYFELASHLGWQAVCWDYSRHAATQG